MDPINYSAVSTDLPSPQQSFMQGVQNGAGLQQLQLQQQQVQLAQQRQAQMNADMAALSQNPTPDAIGKMSIKYPQLSENLKRSVDILDPAQKQAKLDHAVQVYAALRSGQPDIAQKILTDQAAAARNSGNEADARSTETMAELVRLHPESAQTTTGLMLAGVMGADKFATAFPAIEAEQRAEDQAPADLAKKQADAKKAGAEATVAAGTIPALIQKPTEENLNAQTKRRVDEFNAQIAGANSETERGKLVLDRDKFIAEQALKTGTVGADSQNQMDTIGQSIETLKSLRIDPLLDSSIGVGSGIGKILGTLPGTQNHDFRARVETLKSQQFLTAAKEMKGMGALSDAEGARIERAVASLDTDQSVPAFKNALGVIQTTLERGQAKLVASGKLPKAGGAFVMTHPKLGNISEGDINKLLSEHPGSTRDQALKYLQSIQTGGASASY